jgi:hypothetical protein
MKHPAYAWTVVGRIAAVSCVGAVAGLLFAFASQGIGAIATICILIASGVIVVLYDRPEWVVGGVLGLVLGAQNDPGILAFTSPLFSQLGPLRISLADLLVFGGTALVMLSPRSNRDLPAIAWIPLGLAGSAIAFGVINGYLAAGTGFVVAAKTSLYLVLVPLLVFVGLDERACRKAVTAVFAATCVTGIIGILNVLTGRGYTTAGYTISFFTPGSNMVLLLGATLALALMLREGASRLPIAVIALAAPTLYLTQRRAFWIAAGLAVVLVTFTALKTRRQVAVVATCAATALALLLVTQFSASDTLGFSRASNPSSQFAQIHPARGDTYRVDERRNVWANIKRHPVDGIGFGVPWQQSRPLPGNFPGNHQYAHVGLLWMWLRMGILGPLADLGLIGLGLFLCVRIQRSGLDMKLKSLGLAAGITLGMDLFLEMTATFAPVDPRYTLLLAGLVGLLLRIDQIGQENNPEIAVASGGRSRLVSDPVPTI